MKRSFPGCTVHYMFKGEERSSRGRIYAVSDTHVTVRLPDEAVDTPGEHSNTVSLAVNKIPIDQITRTDWIDGADPLITWWDFDRFNSLCSTC